MAKQELWGVWLNSDDPNCSCWVYDGKMNQVFLADSENVARRFATDCTLGGRPGITYEARRMQSTEIVTKEVLPSVQIVARAIFNTDERVMKDVGQFAGELDPAQDTRVDSGEYLLQCKKSRAMAPFFDKCWASNRNNWRAEAEAKAAVIVAEMERLSK